MSKNDNQPTKIKYTPTSILCEMAKLKSQQKYLESAQVNLDFKETVIRDNASISDLQDTKTEIDINLPVFKNNLKNDLECLRSMIRNFETTMMTAEGLSKHDTKEYRDQIIFIDKLFRENLDRNVCAISALKKEYCEIDETLLPSTALLHDGQKVCPTYSVKTKQAMAAPIDRNDIEDVKKFDEFLLSHKGHTGGWTDEEHFLYVKLKNKYKENLDQIQMSIQSILTDKTNKEIQQHDEWYTKYLILKTMKKNAISNWKNNRFMN